MSLRNRRGRVMGPTRIGDSIAGLEVPVDTANHMGIMYQLGTNGGIDPWTNPHTSGIVTVTQSSYFELGTYFPAGAVDRQNTLNAHIAHAANLSASWIKVGLTSNTIALEHLSMQQRGDHPNHRHGASNMLLEGSLDDISWTTIATFAPAMFVKATGVWNELPVSRTPYYRYFRITQTGASSTGDNFFTIGEIEMFGGIG